jgi:hypothetical protein
VNYEERASERMLVRGDGLHAYVPMAHVLAAAEARTLPRFMAELYWRLHRKWADKRGWPPPPDVPLDIAKRLPPRFP